MNEEECVQLNFTMDHLKFLFQVNDENEAIILNILHNYAGKNKIETDIRNIFDDITNSIVHNEKFYKYITNLDAIDMKEKKVFVTINRDIFHTDIPIQNYKSFLHLKTIYKQFAHTILRAFMFFKQISDGQKLHDETKIQITKDATRIAVNAAVSEEEVVAVKEAVVADEAEAIAALVKAVAKVLIEEEAVKETVAVAEAVVVTDAVQAEAVELIPNYITRNFMQYYLKCLENLLLIDNVAYANLKIVCNFYYTLFSKILEIINDYECVIIDHQEITYYNYSLILFLKFYRNFLDMKILKHESHIMLNNILILNDFEEMNTMDIVNVNADNFGGYFDKDPDFIVEEQTFMNVKNEHEYLIKNDLRFFSYNNGSYQINFENIEKLFIINRHDYSFYNMSKNSTIVNSLQLDETLYDNSIFFTIGYSGVGKSRLMLGAQGYDGLIYTLLQTLQNYKITSIDYKEIYGYHIFNDTDKHKKRLERPDVKRTKNITTQNQYDKDMKGNLIEEHDKRFVISTINNPESSRTIITYKFNIQRINNPDKKISIMLVDIPGTEYKLSMYDWYFQIVHELNKDSQFEYKKSMREDKDGVDKLIQNFRALDRSLYETYTNFNMLINSERDFKKILMDIGNILYLKMKYHLIDSIESKKKNIKCGIYLKYNKEHNKEELSVDIFYEVNKIGNIITSGTVKKNFKKATFIFPQKEISKIKININQQDLNELSTRQQPINKESIITGLELELKKTCKYFLINNSFKLQDTLNEDLNEFKNLYYSNYVILKEMYLESIDEAQQYFTHENHSKYFPNLGGISFEREFRIYFQGKFINQNIQNISKVFNKNLFQQKDKGKDKENIFNALNDYVELTSNHDELSKYKSWNLLSINSNINSNKKLLSNGAEDLKKTEELKKSVTLNYERTLYETQVSTLKSIFGARPK